VGEDEDNNEIITRLKSTGSVTIENKVMSISYWKKIQAKFYLFCAIFWGI